MKVLFDKLYSKSIDSFYKILKENLKKEKKMFIVTANPETFMKSETDEELNKLLRDKNTILVPDGIGIVKAARSINYQVEERITGIDIATTLLEYGTELNKSIYLFGSKQEVIDSMKKVLKEKYPNLKLVGASNGYVSNKDEVFENIAKFNPDIVLVALGIPHQEKLIYKHLDKFNKGIFVGVGGSFDVISGHKKRAPKIFIKLNLEWLYRIACEPKRLKRFYDSNVKFMFKVKKNKNVKKKINIIFILILSLYLISGFSMTLLGRKDINYYENRTAYKIPKLELKKVLNKEYQNEMELAFSDQTPLAMTMKKGYNLFNNIINKQMHNIFFSEKCKNNYVNLGNSIVLFGCDYDIVYKTIDYTKDINKYENRIQNINAMIEKTNIPIYFYYIEKDTDIDFSTNKKNNIYEYLKENINSNNIYNYQISNFEEFQQYFYKTDHHWNYKGSYKAYQELVKILTNDSPIEYKEEMCLSDSFSGSKANFGGASMLYNEKFCVYTFDYPEYEIFINGKQSNYGNEIIYQNNYDGKISYGNYYGGDYGEIIFNTNDNTKENILILGESFDNAILKLIASHYNYTYSIDLRNYERENNTKFNYLKYINDNNIDIVLLIGNVDFFNMEEFNLEV